MGVTDKAKELAIIIMSTREFSELKQARSTIDKNRELKSKIEDFKKKEESLYSGKLPTNEAQQRAMELKSMFQSLSTIPEIDKFLKAEKDFNSMLQKVYKTIGDTLESTLKF
ncbi:MAG: YlbF family regulator [Clostridia bacterium]|nr:YlbF family regulator [Clostridia bacterium]